MVSAIATWTCIADTLIDVAGTVDHDGEIHETDNDISDPENYDAEDPTMVRMDFTYGDTREQADMYLQFDENNEWAEGFRIPDNHKRCGRPNHQFSKKIKLNRCRNIW